MAAMMREATDTPAVGEHIVTLAATFHSYSLRSKGDGFDVKFFVPLTESANILSLQEAFQRMIVLNVTRRARRHKIEDEGFVGFDDDAYAGHDDDD